MEWLKVKVGGMPSMGKDCVLAIDEMQLRPTIEFDKGIHCFCRPYLSEVDQCLDNDTNY